MIQVYFTLIQDIPKMKQLDVEVSTPANDS